MEREREDGDAKKNKKKKPFNISIYNKNKRLLNLLRVKFLMQSIVPGSQSSLLSSWCIIQTDKMY
jgi:hypothetical protein